MDTHTLNWLNILLAGDAYWNPPPSDPDFYLIQVLLVLHFKFWSHITLYKIRILRLVA